MPLAAAAASSLSASSLATVKLASDACTALVYVFAGLPAAMALLLDVVSLHIDTHVLMNLAVIGTLVAGLPLEGALLLVLFQTSHTVEHMLTEKAQGSLKTLFDSIPDHADVVQLKEDGSPDLLTLNQVDCKDVRVGQGSGDVWLVEEVLEDRPPWGAPVACGPGPGPRAEAAAVG